MPTPETPILDETAVSEIEAQLKTWTTSGRYPASWNTVNALCATVKHLRAELCKWEDNHDHLCLQREQLYRDVHAENATLQSQLEQLRAENERLKSEQRGNEVLDTLTDRTLKFDIHKEIEKL